MKEPLIGDLVKVVLFSLLSIFFTRHAAASHEKVAEVQAQQKLSVPQAGPWLIAVVPEEAEIGVRRQILVSNGCDTNFGLDSSAVSSGILRIVTSGCGNLNPGKRAVAFAFTPTSTGVIRVLFDEVSASQPSIALSTRAEAKLSTIGGSPSKPSFNLDGMWFDPLSNGSGIAVHQSPTTNAVFGTWFLQEGSREVVGVSLPNPTYFVRPMGPGWLTIQDLNWAAGGQHASAVGYRITSAGFSCGPISNSCPKPFAGAFSGIEPEVVIKLTVFTADNALIETFDLSGKRAFSSSLQRLRF